MKDFHIRNIAAALAFSASAVLVLAQSPRTLELQFKAAQHKEQVEGDLKGAIEQYKKIAQSGDRVLAAKALLAIGECDEKLGQSDARNAYERVVREFSDQPVSVEQARARLSALTLSASHAESARQIWSAPASEDAAESIPSPDGRYIGFTDWDTGDLAIRDLTTGTNRRLTNTGGWEKSGDWAEGTIVSPDSRQIAYGWASPEKEWKYEIRVMPINGGTPRTVYRTRESYEGLTPCGWTPDGKQLLLIHGMPGSAIRIEMMSLQDGSIRVLKSLASRTHAALSPDGRTIAYDAPSPGSAQKFDIFLAAAEGHGESAEVEGSGINRDPVWSSDGARILFLSDRTGTTSLWAAPVRNGKPKGSAQLVKADLGPITPLGMTRTGALYYIPSGSAHTNIYTAEIGENGKVSKPPVLATDRFMNSNFGPALSPDGQHLAYYSRRSGSDDLVIRTLKTGEERDIPLKLEVTPVFGLGPKWFPGGRSVLALLHEPQKRGIDFYRVDLTSGNAELLHRVGQAGFQGFTLSPDGKFIVYTQGANAVADGTRLLRYDIDTRKETELNRGEWFITPTISPDGKQIACIISVRPGSAAIVAIVPVDGGKSRELFRASPWIGGSRYNTLAWTPDQRYLLFVREGRGANPGNILSRIPVSGGQPQQVGLSIMGRIKSPQVTPDGRRIFYGAAESGPAELWALENFLPK